MVGCTSKLTLMSRTTGARRRARARRGHRVVLRILEEPLRLVDARRLPAHDEQQQRDADPLDRRLRRDRRDRHAERQRERGGQGDEPVAVVAARRGREEQGRRRRCRRSSTASSNEIAAIRNHHDERRDEHRNREREAVGHRQDQIAGDAGDAVVCEPRPERPADWSVPRSPSWARPAPPARERSR